MLNLNQTNIVGVFSAIDLQQLDKPLRDLFKIKDEGLDNTESAQAPNMLGFFQNKEKLSFILTANKIRVDNNNGNEETEFIKQFMDVYDEVKKVSNPQSIAFGFNFVYQEIFDDNTDAAKFLKNRFFKKEIFSKDFNKKIDGGGVTLFFNANQVKFSFRIDPAINPSNRLQLQINANHSAQLPSFTIVKNLFKNDIKFVNEFITELEKEI